MSCVVWGALRTAVSVGFSARSFRDEGRRWLSYRRWRSRLLDEEGACQVVMKRLVRWLPLSVLLVGTMLRLGLTIATPPDLAYDDHFEPIQRLMRTGHLPRPEHCWQCYQPPAFYVSGALAYHLGAATGRIGGQDAAGADRFGRKTVQLLSCLAGCLTLWVCAWTLRELKRARGESGETAVPQQLVSASSASRLSASGESPEEQLSEQRGCSPAIEAAALALAAFLPQHIYMSAMITNDALAHLACALAIWAALRAHRLGWPLHASMLTGLFAGLAVLCKAYALTTVAAVWGSLGLFTVLAWIRRRGSAQTATKGGKTSRRASSARSGRNTDRARGGVGAVDTFGGGLRSVPPAALVVVIVMTVLVGVWPGARNLALYGRPHIDNFDLFRTGMHTMPPGSVSAVRLASFKLGDLLAYPWVHARHVSSFWTQLYARYWFDYEGLAVTLPQSRAWAEHWQMTIGSRGWTREGWAALLSWRPGDVPGDLVPVARVAYLAGLPLALAVVAGAALAAFWVGRDFARTLLLANLFACLSVPLFQTLRLPFFAAMKSAFTLGALSSAAALLVLVLWSLRGWLRSVAAGVLGLALLAVLGTNVAFIAIQFGRTAMPHDTQPQHASLSSLSGTTGAQAEGGRASSGAGPAAAAAGVSRRGALAL